jgi:predicted AlkP superfamily phosphohydrolase/phosphomutase
MKRRDFIKATGFLLTFPSLLAQSLRTGTGAKSEKLLVLGFDGMDPRIMRAMANRGQLPNIQRLINSGSLTQMISTAPPESPCAWASFATGLDPAGHGIFGFLGRNPKTYLPFSTSSPISTPSKTVSIGDWRIPIISGDSRIYRKGKPFWDYLQEKNIESTVFKIPSNYPPSEMKYGRALAGMGTPDIYGANGVFTLYTTVEEESMRDLGEKGHVYYAYFDENDMSEGVIEGPENTLKKEPALVEIPFRVYWDRKHRTARIDVQGKEILIEEGGLSEWVELDFELIPYLSSIKGMTRFYLLDANKAFRLYVYPLSIDPADPAQAISSPAGYCRELAKKHGLFHTLGLPADFNAIKTEVFSMENYIVLSDAIFAESNKIFAYELDRFLGLKRGMLFYYFSSIDQGSHIYWALRDPEHPYYKPEETKKFGDRIQQLYQKFDKIVGKVLGKLPVDIPLIVLSDHGFAPLRRKVNLNALLYQQGFLKSHGEPDYSDSTFLASGNANLDETKAYAMGLNGMYLNLKGRESNGIVEPGEKRKVIDDIKQMLLSYKDPQTGQNPIGKVTISEDDYKGKYLNDGPDLIVGCNYSYGVDSSGAMGGIGEEIVSDNLNRWTGDHIIDPGQVPAVLMTNFKMSNKRVPMIWDMAPTILDILGVSTPTDMRGKSIIS